MTITTLSSREFNQNRSRVKRAADEGPVIVTDRGKPSFVVMKYEDYEKMNEKQETLLDRLMMPCDIDIDFEPPRMNLELQIPAFDEELYTNAVDMNQTVGSAQSGDASTVR